MSLPYDAVEQLGVDGEALIALLTRADHAATVRSCPGWDLGELARHLGGVWHFWASLVEQRITDVGDLRTIDRPPPLAGDELLGGLVNQLRRLSVALEESAPDTPVWTWTGANRDVEWVRRRMAQETAVHRWDAGDAVGRRNAVPTVVAADGVDEFLTWFAARERSEGARKVGGTVQLHCTDTGRSDVDGDWFVAAMKEPAARFSRGRRRADAEIRGTAHDVLLWLWRRDGDVDLVGDEVVARRFRAFTDLT